jgi:hypothetical protein
MLRLILIMTGLAAVAGETRAQDATPRVHHVPPADAIAGDPLSIAAQVERGWSATLDLHVRAADRARWRVVHFRRAAPDRYVAAIPADLLRPPGFEYYIASGTPARLHFASPASPHPVLVRPPAAELERQQEVARHRGRRAQARITGELVDFGRRTVEDSATGEERDVGDHYYRIETDFTYRLFRLPLAAIRFGYMRLVGSTPALAGRVGECERDAEQTEGEDGPCSVEAGFRGGAWFELRFRFGRLLAVDGRGLIVATPLGVGFGGRSEVRFGDDTGSHFAVGGEVVQEVGSAFFARLGWDTVPGFPMATTIEITDYPSAHRDAGVRLLYDVAYALPSGLRLGARAGYQARDQFVGGVTGGLNLTFDFWAL